MRAGELRPGASLNLLLFALAISDLEIETCI